MKKTVGTWSFNKIKKIWDGLKSNKATVKKVEEQIKTLSKKGAADKKFSGFSNPKKLNSAKTRLNKLKLADKKRIKKIQKAGLAVGVVATGAVVTDNLIDRILKDLKKYKPYTIKKGDTLSQIAKANGTTLKALKDANPQIKDLNKIGIGQEIMLSPKVEDRKSVYQGMSKSEMATISKDKVVERKHGGQIGTPRGVGKALRGYGKGYK